VLRRTIYEFYDKWGFPTASKLRKNDGAENNGFLALANIKSRITLAGCIR
jgi:hypothetical protein